jgi:hypothetical protein
VEQMLEISDVGKSRHENEINEHDSAVRHFRLLNSVTKPSQHMKNFSRPLELKQCQ